MHMPDLTKRPPRSLRVRLGGYVILPRMLDKGRAEISRTQGAYNFNCPLDQHFLNFTGVDAMALRSQLEAGKGDGEVLRWILENAAHQRTPAEVEQWSSDQEKAGPLSAEQREWFNAMHHELAPHRIDIQTWADLLDLDDYVSFGGNP